jgi:hypothetical protein
MTPRFAHTLLLLSVLVPAFLTACASAPEEPRTVRSSSTVISSDELATMPDSDLYEIVARLSTRWLQPRGVTSLRVTRATGQIVVFMNTTYLGGPEMLRQYRSGEIDEIRYLDGPSAAAELRGYDSSHHVSGAIVLVRSGAAR